jgi:hypothetical protein
MPVLTKINTNVIADDAVTAAKIPADAVGHSELADVTGVTTTHHKIPSVTTSERDALTPAVGMIIYNSTLGIMQQYNALGWQSIDSPPTVSSLTYPVANNDYLEPVGGQTLIISGSNFQVGLTVAIDGTAPSTVTRNSVSQITITTPAKAEADYASGLVVTNPTGLSASADISYSAQPVWTTAAGSLGTFVDGAYTNSSTPTIRVVAAEGSDTIDYAQTNSAGVVNTDGVAGLVLGTTGANAGYLTGTLNGTDGATNNFYVKATDDEAQISTVRLFNIISYDNAATGGYMKLYWVQGSHILFSRKFF